MCVGRGDKPSRSVRSPPMYPGCAHIYITYNKHILYTYVTYSTSVHENFRCREAPRYPPSRTLLLFPVPSISFPAGTTWTTPWAILIVKSTG